MNLRVFYLTRRGLSDGYGQEEMKQMLPFYYKKTRK